MKKKLDRALGLYSAVAISVGTMIGSAIFVLAGTSFQVAGPSASLSIFLAGVGAFFTAFSFAELVTIVPYSGGGYVYARDASGNGLIGFITGWGFWLGYAMSCGLFALGFGNFLHYFFPSIPVMAGAYSLILYVMITNVKGAKNTGRLQNIITTGLLILLATYIVRGAFFADLSIQRPFMPNGFGGMFSAMGFLYITYEGFGLITTVSEEVVNPKKVIPKAIIISLITVILIKTAVFFLSSSVIRWDMLVPNITSTPLTDISVKIGGMFGGHLFAFAGILAMVSSINTAMMAASRTCFAMARDNHLPAIFKNINSKTQTPVVSIIVVFLLVVISTGIRDLKHISTVTSLFVLTGYSFVNVALMIFRKKMPKVKRAYKVPFYPLTPIAGTAVNIFLVIRLMISNPVAVSIALGITLLGIAYYFVVLPKLKEAPKAFSAQPLPQLQADGKDIEKKFKILLPVASPYSVNALVDVSVKIASAYRGTVQPVHIVEVADTIQLNSEYDDLDG
ncbi:MAG TPA: amino acid permease, partial [Firmicutes bacterium]|nr:amino acid permease [Bacillota bacterium]